MRAEKALHDLELMQARVTFVPAGWSFSKVADVFAIRNNLRKPISETERDKDPGPFPYYGPTRVQGYIGGYCQDGEYALIGEDGDHFLKYQSHQMTQMIEGKCTVNNHAHIIAGTRKACREWFYYYFMHRDIFSFLTRQGAGRFKLNKAALEKIPLLVPPFAEQQKIAKILSAWDEAIATIEQLLANSEQEKKALMQQLLTGKKRLPGFEEDLSRLKLSEAAHVSMGSSPKSAAYNEEGIGLPLVQGNADIKNRESAPRIYSAEITKECEFGDILLSVRAPVGTVAVAQHHACIGRGICSIRAGKNASQEYLYQWMLLYEPRWASKAQGSTFESINSVDVKNLEIKLPDLREQIAVAQILHAADREADALVQEIQYLRQEKKALMQQLLTGKRRVKIDEAERVSA